MLQTGLIESIIQDVGLTASSNTKTTPADSILHSNPSNTPWQDPWNYRSILGKLNFLAQNTRPDIRFAVHQCAPFLYKTHRFAGTRPNEDCLLPGSDSASRPYPTSYSQFSAQHVSWCWLCWPMASATFPSSWLCPLLDRLHYYLLQLPHSLVSKLQAKIALSTTESEYIALSMATRDLLPLCCLLLEIHTHGIM
jgi:hypothetical protein